MSTPGHTFLPVWAEIGSSHGGCGKLNQCSQVFILRIHISVPFLLWLHSSFHYSFWIVHLYLSLDLTIPFALVITIWIVSYNVPVPCGGLRKLANFPPALLNAFPLLWEKYTPGSYYPLSFCLGMKMQGTDLESTNIVQLSPAKISQTTAKFWSVSL